MNEDLVREIRIKLYSVRESVHSRPENAADHLLTVLDVIIDILDLIAEDSKQ